MPNFWRASARPSRRHPAKHCLPRRSNCANSRPTGPHLVRLLVAQQNRRAQLSNKTLLGLDHRLTSQLRKQIAQIEALLAASIEQDQELSRKARQLTSIVGVGPRTATLLLAQMPELGQLNRREAAALAGLAPFNRDSGSLHGKRAIFGGRRAVRCGLYMAALVAARRNPILAPFYQRLRRAGKPPKLALHRHHAKTPNRAQQRPQNRSAPGLNSRQLLQSGWAKGIAPTHHSHSLTDEDRLRPNQSDGRRFERQF
jgi:transposase